MSSRNKYIGVTSNDHKGFSIQKIIKQCKSIKYSFKILQMQQDTHIINNPPEHIPTLSEAAYSVTIQQKTTGLSKTTNSTIQYNLNVEKSNEHIFNTWKKSNFRLNNSKDTIKMDSLYLKVSEPLNNLKFSIDKNRKIKEIHNYDALLKEWKQHKRIILKEYTGEIVDVLVQKMTDNLLDYDTLKESLSRDLVLQHFLSTTLNDYLIYYGEHKDSIRYSGLINKIPLTFKRKTTLGLKGENLHLQSDARLDMTKLDTESITHYFKPKISDFNIQNFEATVHSDLELNYNSIWIENATIVHTISLAKSNYKKETVLTIKKATS